MGSTDLELVQRRDLIFRMCEGKRVLHLGCTNYPYTKETIDNETLLHFELAKVASEICGFDADERGLQILKDHGCHDLYEVDLERLEEIEVDAEFDIIIAGEMIEHLNNPGAFLTGIQRFMGPETRLVITTVNAYCGMRFFQYAFRGKHGRNEPVHPDHVAYYSYSTLNLLLRRHELDIEKFYFYDLGDEHRPFARRMARLFNDVCVWFSPHLADGVIAVCRRGQR